MSTRRPVKVLTGTTSKNNQHRNSCATSRYIPTCPEDGGEWMRICADRWTPIPSTRQRDRDVLGMQRHVALVCSPDRCRGHQQWHHHRLPRQRGQRRSNTERHDQRRELMARLGPSNLPRCGPVVSMLHRGPVSERDGFALLHSTAVMGSYSLASPKLRLHAPAVGAAISASSH